ncbi:hypothetical protein JTB14_033275 [Gonioctena quinquepunctata]|nr:hypothetical protein JTB14_033275 [Gonioctena quinquepunctata]
METQSTEAVEDSNYISSDTTEEHTTRSEQNTRKQFQNSTRIVPKNRRQNGSTKNKDAKADEAYNIMTTMYNERKTRDDYDIYGEYVGRKIKRLRTEHAQVTVQQLINYILCRADMGEFDAPPAQYRRETMEPGCYGTYQSPPSHSSFTTSEATQDKEMPSFLQLK